MGANRMDRINSHMREVISSILRRVKDPRLSSLISVTEVVTSKDLRSARVYVSLMASSKEKRANIEALKSAKGYIRKELGKEVSFKTTPELNFYWDDSIERGVRVVRKIEMLKEKNEL